MTRFTSSIMSLMFFHFLFSNTFARTKSINFSFFKNRAHWTSFCVVRRNSHAFAICDLFIANHLFFVNRIVDFCSNHDVFSVSNHVKSMKEIQKYLINLMFFFDNQNSFWFDFFHQFDMLFRDENNRDYHEFKYKQLLIEHFSLWILSLIKNETKFFRDFSLIQFITNRKYDIDNFQTLITILKVFRQIFSFCYLFFYFQRIIQNLKIDIEKMTSHKIKQFCIDSNVNDVDINFHVHVFFFH